MKVTRELLEKQKAALVAERDGYLAEMERLTGQATGCEGAIRVVDHMLTLLDKPEPEAGGCIICGKPGTPCTVYRNGVLLQGTRALCPTCQMRAEEFDRVVLEPAEPEVTNA